MNKTRAHRNRTITLSQTETERYSKDLIRISKPAAVNTIENKIVNQDTFEALGFLPESFVDLLLLDPPYNLTKTFNSTTFRKKSITKYAEWLENLLAKLLPTLKNTASVYVCSEWYSSTAAHLVLDKLLNVRNRITWEREKGRGAKSNWKNNTEDIWFCTCGSEYFFNVDAVKLKRKVIAPYRTDDGKPKDWDESQNGNYRLTYPSNLWSDITIPFWSMPENTDHPTQKPEKLIAKLIMASSKEGDFVFDPFLGSGTTAVAAKKLHRRFCGVEINLEYCCWAEKRLRQVESDTSIQGYSDGVFWERNSLNDQKTRKKTRTSHCNMLELFND